MIDITHSSVHYSGPLIWEGPGIPVCHSFQIPDILSICGTVCRGQGLWFDPGGTAGPFTLTNRVDFTLGS